MKIFPKLNVFLNVLSPDFKKMHPIFSRFVLARGDLYDEMEIKFEGNCFEIKGNFDFPMHKNLIFKAKEELKNVFPSLAKELETVQVEIKKNIPQGAGLGGGSANAGAFLLCVGKHFGISKEDLTKIAPKIGSDVSFFISEYLSANVSGVGEVVEEFLEVNATYEIFTPSFCCETKAVYEAFDAFCSPSLKTEFLNLPSIDLLKNHSVVDLNDLYLPATKIYPKLKDIARDLGDKWFFSGSGSSFFRISQ